MNDQEQKITLVREIDAPPAMVYAAFTTPEGWCEWCCEEAECEAFVGGKLHIYTEGYHAYGEYKVLVRDRVAAFSWDGDDEPPTLVHVLLEAQDQGTKLTFTVTIVETEGEQGEFAEILEPIWGRALNNLKAVLEARPA